MSGRLRSYAPLSKRSTKVEDGEAAFKAVYAEVDARSEGRCEVTFTQGGYNNGRCPKRGVEHHHLYKPRRSNHTEEQVVHVCRQCHDRMEWPFLRGRLCYLGRMAAAFLFAIRFAKPALGERHGGHFA